MTRTASATAATVVSSEPALGRQVGSVCLAAIESTKPGISVLVAYTAAVGYAAGVASSSSGGGSAAMAGLCVAGTLLAAAGANALNQWMERDRDGVMPRTAGRPLPSGRLKPATVVALGAGLSAIGVGVLALASGLVPAVLAILTLAWYLLAYTPMKRVSPWAVVIGAVPGALPVMIGWAASAAPAGIDALRQAGGWSLFAVLFAWQVPHFLAIAWLYRDDYAAGGFRVLPVVDATGQRTGRQALGWTVALAGVTVVPLVVLRPWLGLVYALAAIGTGAMMVQAARGLAGRRTRAAARRLFLASIVQLPVLLTAVLIEAAVAILST